MSRQILAPLSINAAGLKLRGRKLPGYLEVIDDIGQPGGNQAPKYRPSGESADEVQRYIAGVTEQGKHLPALHVIAIGHEHRILRRARRPGGDQVKSDAAGS